MADKIMRLEYYQYAESAGRILYELELNIKLEDIMLGDEPTDEEKIRMKVAQRLFWDKFDVSQAVTLEKYTGKMFVAKQLASNNRTEGYRHLMTLSKEIQRKVGKKAEEYTAYPPEKRIGDNGNIKCDKCKEKIIEMSKCLLCNYARYCSNKCTEDDAKKHRVICVYIREYLGYDKGFP